MGVEIAVENSKSSSSQLEKMDSQQLREYLNTA